MIIGKRCSNSDILKKVEKSVLYNKIKFKTTIKMENNMVSKN